MHADIETAARENLAQVLASGIAPGDFDLDRDLADTLRDVTAALAQHAGTVA